MKQLIFISLILVAFSCHKAQKFDKVKWLEVSDLMTFPHRKSMVDDLVKNHPLIGKKYSEIFELLGQPQSNLDHTNEIFYDIDIKYGSDIDPIYTKTLLISFDKDTIVKSIKINEWKK